jgi:uncharacterized protein with HEPN domain
MRDFRIFLDDILDAVAQIREYVGGMSQEEFAKDRKTQDAVVRNLEIIGEASGRLPEEVLQKAQPVEWRKIKALRNILIHEYFGINLSIVWDVVQKKLGPLEAACRELLSSADEKNHP